MRIILDLNNTDKSPFKKAFVRSIIKKTIDKTNLNSLKSREICISFANVDENSIKKMNKAYRKKNYPTDVLAFAEYKNQSEIKKIVDKKVFLGEIILCYNNIADYSNKYKLDLKREIRKVVSHGVLHLLGFCHGKKMFKIQDSI
jgi:probable rRNA maturation factor